jgi:hypothetical protein
LPKPTRERAAVPALGRKPEPKPEPKPEAKAEPVSKPAPSIPEPPAATRQTKPHAAIPSEPVVAKPLQIKATTPQRDDATIVTSPPPAPAAPAAPVQTQLAHTPAHQPVPLPGVAPIAAATPAAPVVPAAAAAEAQAKRVGADADAKNRRSRSDSVAKALDGIFEATPQTGGVSTAADLAEVKRVFEQVAVVHVAQVRDVMLELRYGEASGAWIELTRPALASLRAMAAQIELVDLCKALDEFCAGVDATLASGGVSEVAKTDLLGRYQRLIDQIPQAFELDAERDRREPVIVEALLYQIEGVEKPTIDKLFAVGLNRLEPLLKANADEIAVVANVRVELAAAIVARMAEYRSASASTIAARDQAAERRALHDLLVALSVYNDDFNRAAEAWTDAANARKREARKRRDQVFQQIRVALARLGEREQLARLEKLPFGDRIAALDRFLSTSMVQKA